MSFKFEPVRRALLLGDVPKGSWEEARIDYSVLLSLDAH